MKIINQNSMVKAEKQKRKKFAVNFEIEENFFFLKVNSVRRRLLHELETIEIN